MTYGKLGGASAVDNETAAQQDEKASIKLASDENGESDRASPVASAATSETWRTVLDDVLWPSDPDYTRMENAVEDLELRLRAAVMENTELKRLHTVDLQDYQKLMVRAEAAERERDALKSMVDAATEIQGDAEVLKYVTSSNAVPVTRCTVSADLIRQLVAGRQELASVKDDSDRLDWVLANCQSLILARGIVLPANTREEIDKARAEGGKT